jgi:hypothetical protein
LTLTLPRPSGSPTVASWAVWCLWADKKADGGGHQKFSRKKLPNDIDSARLMRVEMGRKWIRSTGRSTNWFARAAFQTVHCETWGRAWKGNGLRAPSNIFNKRLGLAHHAAAQSANVRTLAFLEFCALARASRGHCSRQLAFESHAF